MKIALLFMLSYYFDLMIQTLDYSKYSEFFILGFFHHLAFKRYINTLYIISNTYLLQFQT